MSPLSIAMLRKHSFCQFIPLCNPGLVTNLLNVVVDTEIYL